MLPILKYENKLWDKGYHIIAGVDEVGRGPLAGPIVGCAVAWNYKTIDNLLKIPHKKELLLKITDSKKVTKKNREILSEFIRKECLGYEICEISAKEIDEIGIGIANKKVLRNAVINLSRNLKIDYVLVDYFSICTNDCKISELSLKKGDQVSFAIASASIVAKVYRDNLMYKYSKKYSQYSLDTNVGYGTKKHLLAIKKYGYTPIHRKSYKIKLPTEK